MWNFWNIVTLPKLSGGSMYKLSNLWGERKTCWLRKSNTKWRPANVRVKERQHLLCHRVAEAEAKSQINPRPLRVVVMTNRTLTGFAFWRIHSEFRLSFPSLTPAWALSCSETYWNFTPSFERVKLQSEVSYKFHLMKFHSVKFLFTNCSGCSKL